LVLLLAEATGYAFGQTLEWSPPLRIRSKSNYMRILGVNSDGHYILRSRHQDFSRDVYIERYKASLSLDLVKELPGSSRSRFENVLLYEDGLLIFRSVENPASNTIELQANKADASGVVNANTWLKIDECPKRSNGDKGDYTIVSSSNKDLLVCSHSETNQKNQAVLSITIVNRQLVKQAGKKLELEFPVENIQFNELQIDNNSNVFFSVIYTDTDKKKQTSERNKHLMYAWFKHTDELKYYPLDEKGRFINTFSFGVNYVKKCLTVCGFYSNISEANVGGTFLCNIDLDSGFVFYSKYQGLSQEFVARLIGEKEASRSGELSNIEMRKLILRSDGGMIMAAENTYVTQQTYTYYVSGMPQYSYRNIYNYDDILVISLDPDGNEEWHNLIRKKQSTMNDQGYFSSFFAAAYDNKIHFLYNDNSRNNGDVLDVVINNKGELEKNVLLNAKTTFAVIVPSEARMIAYNTLLITTLKEKNYCFLKITF
jgi:hypothetical protein